MHAVNRIAAAMAGLVLSAAPAFSSTAFSSDVFVIDAKGLEMQPGTKLDGSKPLTLDVGQRITLVTSDGRTIKLKGPSAVAPAPDTVSASGDVVSSLKGLIQARDADTTSAGIIRSGTVAFSQPTPWLVEVRHSGDRCLIGGEKAVLWAGQAVPHDSDIEITPSDQSWTAHASWRGGDDMLTLPVNLKLNNGQAYVVRLENEPVNLTIHVIPATVKSDAAKAAWMIEMGCEVQAQALIATMQ